MKIVINLKSIYTKNILNYFKGLNYEFYIVKTEEFDLTELLKDIESKKCKYTLIESINLMDEYIIFNNYFIPDVCINNYIYYCRASEENCILLNNNKQDFYYNSFEKKHNIKVIEDRHLLKINKKVIYSPHWGWTDFVILNPLINYYNSIFEEVILLIEQGNTEQFLKLLYPNNIIPWVNIIEYNERGKNFILEHIENYIFLIDGHQGTQCLPMVMNKIVLPTNTFISRLNIELLKQSAQNSMNIDDIKYRDLHEDLFDERISFYLYSYLDEETIYKYFHIERNIYLENEKYNNFNKKEYVVGHIINEMRHIQTNYPIYNLSNCSNYILDTLKIIEQAKEVHIFDSLYGTIIYLLINTSNFLENTPIYYHKYAREKIPKFYTRQSKWIILK